MRLPAKCFYPLSSRHKYSGTSLYGPRLIRTPRYYGQFRWSRRNAHIFSLKLTRLIRTPDSSLCPERQTLIHCQPRFTDTFYLCTVYFQLSKGLSNIQFHLAESQTKSASMKKSHGIFQMIPFSCFKNNKVILVRDCDK